jgi:F0F1-type ATP synthase alpha subunit
MILYAGIYGYLDNIAIENIANYERKLFQFVDQFDIFHPFLENISELKTFDLKNNIIKNILENFKF